jgi:hypothetical protein
MGGTVSSRWNRDCSPICSSKVSIPCST